MSLFSLSVISTILRGLPHWPLLAGLLFPGNVANDSSQILAAVEPRQFVVPEPSPVAFDPNRPQGKLKSVLFVVVRDKGHFPIENIQITVGTSQGNEATQYAEEGWAAFELDRSGPFQGNLHVTVSGPPGIMTAEQLEGATFDLALLLDEAQSEQDSEKAAEEKQDLQKRIHEPVLLHRWRFNVEERTMSAPVAASSGPIPILLGMRHDFGFQGFGGDQPNGITSPFEFVPLTRPAATEFRPYSPVTTRLNLTPLKFATDSSGDSTMGRRATQCRDHLQESQFLPHAFQRRWQVSEILVDHQAARRDLLSLLHITRGAASAEATGVQFWATSTYLYR